MKSRKSDKPSAAAPCPCDSGRSYASCCEPLHEGAPAPDAVSLMRSRYSAFVLGLKDYLSSSWHPSTRPAAIAPDPEGEAATRWLGLKIIGHERIDDTHATVEFVARFRIGGQSAVRQHELSRFVRDNDHWYYVDGDVRP